eukprot:TRINITY_DN14080_c0_g1_i1.p1 TRINITY_DN14080_c0_g1~~TRINITY_DN14080_c0_g1_i1.p1  ORF type:complete len:484 (-),score=87.89 TRINITY_DN14080_c0_g1_i1:1259-2710(-)
MLNQQRTSSASAVEVEELSTKVSSAIDVLRIVWDDERCLRKTSRKYSRELQSEVFYRLVRLFGVICILNRKVEASRFFLLNLMGQFDLNESFSAKIGFDVAKNDEGVYLHTGMISDVHHREKLIIHDLKLFDIVEQFGESYVYSVLRRRMMFVGLTGDEEKSFQDNFECVAKTDYFSLKKFCAVPRHRSLLTHILFARKPDELDELMREKLGVDFVSLHNLSGTLSDDQNVEIIVAVGCAVLALHAEGVSHGAVMLRNVWVSKSQVGDVRLLTFEHGRSLNANPFDLQEWERDFKESYPDGNESRVMEKDVTAFCRMMRLLLNSSNALPALDQISSIGEVLSELSCKRYRTEKPPAINGVLGDSPREEVGKMTHNDFTDDSKFETKEEEWGEVSSNPKSSRSKKTLKSKHQVKSSGKNNYRKFRNRFLRSRPSGVVEKSSKAEPHVVDFLFFEIPNVDFSSIQTSGTYRAALMFNAENVKLVR